MPVEAMWDNPEQTMLVHVYTSPWTWDEARAAADTAFALAATVSHTYVTIINLEAASLLPKGSFFTESKGIAGAKPPNAHNTMLVAGAASLLQSLANTFLRLYGRRLGNDASVRFVSTMEAARNEATRLLGDE